MIFILNELIGYDKWQLGGSIIMLLHAVSKTPTEIFYEHEFSFIPFAIVSIDTINSLDF